MDYGFILIFFCTMECFKLLPALWKIASHSCAISFLEKQIVTLYPSICCENKWYSYSVKMRNSELYANLNASIAFLCQILKAILLSDIKLFTWGWCFLLLLSFCVLPSLYDVPLLLFLGEHLDKTLMTLAHNATSLCYLPAGTTLREASLLFHINDSYGRRFFFFAVPKHVARCGNCCQLRTVNFSKAFRIKISKTSLLCSVRKK